MTRPALTLIAMLTLCGCVTHHWIAKAVSGKVVDADSGKALSGVNVYRVIEGKSVLVATTDSAGEFSVPPLGKVYVEGPVLGDPFYSASLVFRVPGYKEEQLYCSTSTGEVVAAKAPSLAPTIVRLHKRSNQALQPTAPLRYAFDVDLS
jgi:hypothetical protein